MTHQWWPRVGTEPAAAHEHGKEIQNLIPFILGVYNAISGAAHDVFDMLDGFKKTNELRMIQDVL